MNLRPYQQEDAEFLGHLNRAGCFNEQRTGKTPVILTVLKNRKLNTVVVLCPKSAVPVWKTEQTTWHPDLGHICVTGTYAKKAKLINNWTTELLIISYDSFKTTKKALGFINQILTHKPNAVIIDEAHRIQNRKTAVTQAVMKLKKIPIRYALTGTPAISKSYKIWTILNWLYPEYFHAYWKFIKEYFSTYTIKNKKGDEITKEGNLRRDKRDKLWAILSKFCTERKRKDVMPWLPDKEHIPVLLEPTSEQLKYLNELEEYFETENVVVQNTLTRLIRYRQICLDPGLLGLRGSSPKTEWVLDFLQDYPEEKVIIFSKFSQYLLRLDKTLYDHGYNTRLITGACNENQREEFVDLFQHGNLNILLIQIDAAKEALTLDAATVEIFTDKYPPIGYIEQAEDRFVSTTEDKADKSHRIYELQIEGTYDTVIYEMLKANKAEVDFINDFIKFYKRKI